MTVTRTPHATATIRHPALRGDTMLGVCQAIGDELGFNPTWLRIAFALAMFFAPGTTLLVYAALALIIAAIYWKWPLRAAGETPARARPVSAQANDAADIARAA